MSIEKSLYAAPEGLEALDDGEELDIEVSDDIELGEDQEPPEEPIGFDENLVEHLDPSVVEEIVSEIVSDFEDDLNSRKDWIKAYVDGLELLGLKIEERMDPWPGACGVYHPLLSESLVKFQAETIMEIFPASGPCKDRNHRQRNSRKERRRRPRRSRHELPAYRRNDRVPPRNGKASLGLGSIRQRLP